jgi:putative transposase
MPWKEGTRVTERSAMVAKWKSGLYGISELAREFGVSRPTVYLWISRGEGDLVDRAPLAQSCPHRTDPRIVARIVEAKRAHPRWGPRKLIWLLRNEEPAEAWPAASTAGAILETHGLVKKRLRRRARPGRYWRGPLEADESGEMMTIDHKGHFRLGNGRYCYPLTIADPVSRYIYAIAGSYAASFQTAKPAMEAVFRKYGLPRRIGSDNGGPFCCSRALAGLSRLSVWWIRLGVTPLRIHPGCPWENGIHERMHQTLKGETTRPPAASMAPQQERFDTFREEFNFLRPHEGLDGATPTDRLKPCARAFPRRLPSLEYPAHVETRRVKHTGEIKFQAKRLFLSEALAGEWVGLEEIGDGVWAIQFAHLELARYDERTKSIT